jgi:hypothetical protein
MTRHTGGRYFLGLGYLKGVSYACTRWGPRGLDVSNSADYPELARDNLINSALVTRGAVNGGKQEAGGSVRQDIV